MTVRTVSRTVGIATASALIFVSGCSSGSGETPAPATSSATASALLPLDPAALDAMVEDVATTSREIGMVVLITTPDGEYVKTWGSVAAGRSEVPTLDTKVRIGSNTKTWTGTVILQMVQEGLLSVDDPVSTFRPDVPNGDAITIGQLLDMRSGLYSYTQTVELNEALDTDPGRVWSAEELVALGLSNPPNFPPGEGYSYSNTNTVLLGLIAEKLDGKPIDRIFQDRLFGPLALAGTSYPATTDTSIPAPFTRGYSYSGNVETLGEGKEALSPDRIAAIDAGSVQPRDTTNDNPSWTSSAGQGISTANDLATWVRALVRGDLLDADTQTVRMDSVQPTDPDNPSSAGYGYGLAQMGPMFGHIGEMPGYNSFMGYDPVNDLTMVVWANMAPGTDGSAPAAALAGSLAKALYAQQSGPSSGAEDTADDIDEVAEDTGK